jgi:hypothetical protein
MIEELDVAHPNPQNLCSFPQNAAPPFSRNVEDMAALEAGESPKILCPRVQKRRPKTRAPARRLSYKLGLGRIPQRFDQGKRPPRAKHVPEVSRSESGPVPERATS